MTTLQLLIVCITVLFIVALVTRKEQPEPIGVFDDLGVGDKVAAYTSDGQSVIGLVASTPNGRLILSDAALVTGGSEVKLGNVRIPGDAVHLVQVVSRAPEP
jgi:hypothetical protein